MLEKDIYMYISPVLLQLCNDYSHERLSFSQSINRDAPNHASAIPVDCPQAKSAKQETAARRLAD